MPNDVDYVFVRSREMIDRARVLNALTRLCLATSRQTIDESRQLLERLGSTVVPGAVPGPLPRRS